MSHVVAPDPSAAGPHRPAVRRGRSVLVVDDHHGFRREVAALLELDGFEVLGEASDGAGALAETARLRPAVVLLDIGLPDVDGLALIGTIRELAPDAVVVAVSGRREAEYGGRVAQARPDAFLEKGTLAPGVLSALLDEGPSR